MVGADVPLGGHQELLIRPRIGGFWSRARTVARKIAPVTASDASSELLERAVVLLLIDLRDVRRSRLGQR